MVADTIAILEARFRSVNRQLELLRQGKLWHVGTAESARARLLAELDDIEYQMARIAAGLNPETEDGR